MLKKIISCFVAICFALVLYSPSAAFAAQKSISSNTVITEDNIYDVLEYLGLDSSSFTKTEGVVYNDYQTVGDLEKYIATAKEQYDIKNVKVQEPKIIKTTTDTSSTDTLLDASGEMIASSSPSYGNMTLQWTFDVGSYILTFYGSGNYRTSYWSGTIEQIYHPPIWTGSSFSRVEVDTDTIAPVYKIEYQTGGSTYSTSTITINCSYTVGVYIGVLDLGLIRVATYDGSSVHEFSVYDYVS